MTRPLFSHQLPRPITRTPAGTLASALFEAAVCLGGVAAVWLAVIAFDLGAAQSRPAGHATYSNDGRAAPIHGDR